MSNKRRHHARPAPAPGNGHLPPATSAALATVEQAVERAQTDSLSLQPRFGKDVKPGQFYGSVRNWIGHADLQEPAYVPESKKRDAWLRNFWRYEPHLAGVMNSVVALDKNRGWSLTGGRNQVYRMTDVLHSAQAAPGLVGWRNFVSSQALSFYATDIGTIGEIGTVGKGGPLRGLFHTDSARCKLTGSSAEPIEYQPATGKMQRWPDGSFYRVVSMPSDDEAYSGLGYCATSRVLELAKLMVAIFRKDSELLGARMPEGLLLLQGIQQDQWDQAMADREAKLTAKERQYFGGVFVLATAGIDQVDAKLVALRQLPENFNLQVFTDQLMFAYALTFGYSPREFWPVSSGSLGSATESETQDDNSTGKGESDFILNHQEQLNETMPASILFEYDQRDSKGDLEVLAIQNAKASFIDAMSKLSSEGTMLLDAERIMQLASEQGLIPEEWLNAPADTTSTDTEGNELAEERERARRDPRVMRAAALYPSEPIVRYHYPTGRETVLWESGQAVTRRAAWQGVKSMSDMRRLARAIENATRVQAQLPALRAAPVAAVPAPQPVTFNVLAGADGAAIMRASEPQIVEHRFDFSPLADAISTGMERMVRSLPAPMDSREVAGVVGETVGRVLAAMPKPPDTAVIAGIITRSISQMPKGPSAAELAEIIVRALPEPAAMDYAVLAAALAEALKSLPVPVVNVHVPEQPGPEIVVERPTKETATFAFQYDTQGKIVGATKEGKQS